MFLRIIVILLISTGIFAGKLDICQKPNYLQFQNLNKLLKLPPYLKNYVLNNLKCLAQLDFKPYLTIIDFAKPSNEKRLWVYNLKNNRLVFHTYVSHGINSGILYSNNFSNVHNSKASSLGVFKTGKSYYGRYGLALKLKGLETSFNDYAQGRAIVMHAAWYMNEEFIKKYGRPGRSWGCPAIPKKIYKSLINTIKDESLLIAYYPEKTWLSRSKYSNCKNLSHNPSHILEFKDTDNSRNAILFVDRKHDDTWNKFEPVLVLNANDYVKIFQSSVPLQRMVRRQIQNQEYIALTTLELKKIFESHNSHKVDFIIPVIKTYKGRYVGTIMKILPNIKLSKNDFRVKYNHKNFKVLESKKFIRWLGL